MGFRINTNIAALNAHTSATMNNRSLDNSLSRLSSGLRINTAADDASGMAIADSLRSQASSLGQAVSNSNDAIGLIQTADKAMDEQLKILDTIKTKAVQAANDTQTTASRQAIQKDVSRLLEQLDNIAKTTSFNGQVLLSGNYTNKEFQVGAYSNQTINASIQNTQSLAIGNITSKTDIAAVGNTAQATISDAGGKIVQGSDTITFTGAVALDATGLAVGDTIRIDGVGDYTIKSLEGSLSDASISTAIIKLDRALEKSISVGGTLKISLVNTVAENLGSITTATLTADTAAVTMVSKDVTGFATGDKINITNSVGTTVVYAVQSVTGYSVGSVSGTVVIAATSTPAIAAALSNSTVFVSDRASLGTDFTSNDYIQYTVDGVALEGVQLTEKTTVVDSSGASQIYASGVAQSGLGRVADLVNATTDKTGIKAVATVEQNSAIRVQDGSLSSDIVINGVTILDKGASIKAADKDNTLVSNINAKTKITGVTASLEADGSLTLSSDGRAIVTNGLSAVAGINDGVHAGKITFTNTQGGNIDATSKHYSDAGLITANASADTLDEVTKSNVLSDLVYGQVDDNNDNVINADDQVGLLLTKKVL